MRGLEEKVSHVMPKRAIWKNQMNQPLVLNDTQLQELIGKSNPLRSPVRHFQNDVIPIKFHRHCQIQLVQVCSTISSTSKVELKQPFMIAFKQMSSTHLFITWRFDQPPVCLSHFVVEHSRDGQNFETVSSARGLNRFLDHFVEEEDMTGYYRIFAEDLFGAKGPYSVPRFYLRK